MLGSKGGASFKGGGAELCKKLEICNLVLEEKAALISQATLSFEQYCLRRIAHCLVPESDLEMGGSPCADHSKQGLQRGKEGFTASAYYVMTVTQRVKSMCGSGM